MSTEPLPTPEDEGSRYGDASPGGFWNWVDQWADAGSEWLNPILVKEARQALKSNMFRICFALLLACLWIWSFYGVTMESDSVYSGGSGPEMYNGYFVCLAIPLMIVIPFAAFRSLASEREDGTYEVLSVSTLRPRQIVMGKLASATLLIVLFCSALMPAIVFTYLLRGIDLATILYPIGLTVLFSLCLSMVALMLATASRNSALQVFFSIVLMIGLLGACFGWISLVVDEIVDTGVPAGESEFWVANVLLLAFLASYFALMLVSSAAQISFPSNNRSTPIRIVMVGQQVVYVGVIVYFWLAMTERNGPPPDEFWYVFLFFAAAHWSVLGALMTGEVAELSPRVRRALPKTFLGRLYLTWFNPGSGTGYCFALVNYAALVAVFGGLSLWESVSDVKGAPDGEVIAAGVLMTCYLAIYLGIGRLMIVGLRRAVRMNVLIALLFQTFLAFVGVLAPVVIQWLTIQARSMGRQGYYTWMQYPNWLVTMNYALENRLDATPLIPGTSVPAVWLVVPAVAAVVFLLNLVSSAHELEQTRLATPIRVLEDQGRTGGRVQERSPWDTPEDEPLA